ncbi:MAG: RNA polymerase sigma factor [Chitinophagales bacterium]|nr:RNA polymerase sigma factor [Chitinophagales bacterium]HAE14610.1 RNA polymerase sigma factor [Bacteroidota bacterium]MCB9022663.1 RNA polymerase sigma factor [Chitinophagales bacterium]HAE35494.1 RNA polymerase sigma factor [Bacteroidota bacterium]HPE97701.1 RNA polymerase sigma factor [Chitinophagales bacterium]
MTTTEYNECVELWADGVFRFIVKNLRHEEDARDVVQNAFEVLWKNHSDIDAAKAKSYLFSTAYHNMIDLIRKQKRVDYVEEVEEGARGGTSAYQVDLKEALDKALARLPEIQRNAVLLRDYEGYSYEEIGEILELTESQVKVYIFRARTTLKKYLVSIHHLI